jgi:hypothetical protein
MLKYVVVGTAVLTAACSGSSGTVNARPMPANATVLTPGDCVSARRLAAAEPEMLMDKLPEKVGGPQPFVPTPASVAADVKKNGMSFKAEVLIDTLGKPVVSSLKVIETSNEWFPRNLAALLPRMTFSPAILGGCKVERVYKFNASAKPQG